MLFAGATRNSQSPYFDTKEGNVYQARGIIGKERINGVTNIKGKAKTRTIIGQEDFYFLRDRTVS